MASNDAWARWVEIQSRAPKPGAAPSVKGVPMGQIGLGRDFGPGTCGQPIIAPDYWWPDDPPDLSAMPKGLMFGASGLPHWRVGAVLLAGILMFGVLYFSLIEAGG